MNKTSIPLVYSCSGCSSAAQMANHLAVQLDRHGLAEMSCIAGVGGDVPQLVKVARSGRPILAVDGCPLHCVANCLQRHGVVAERHVTLSEFGVRRRPHEDFDPDHASRLLERLSHEARALVTPQPPQRTAPEATLPAPAPRESNDP